MKIQQDQSGHVELQGDIQEQINADETVWTFKHEKVYEDFIDTCEEMALQ